jgi:hypothetical protein
VIDSESGVDWEEVVRDYVRWELTVLEIRRKHMLSSLELYKFLEANPEVPRRRRFRRGGAVRSGYRVGAWDGRAKYLPDRSLDRVVYWYANSAVPVAVLERVMKVSHERLYWELRIRGVPLRGRGRRASA